MATPSASAIRRRDATLALARTALDLAQEALAQPGALRDLPQRLPAAAADHPQALADVDLGDALRGCRNRLDLCQRNLK